MKKVVILLLLSFFLITGCTKSIEPFKLDDKYYEEGTFEELSTKDIKKLEKDKESFVVFVYMASCTSCRDFDAVLEDFLKDNKIKIYKISLLDIEGTDMEENVRYSPSIVIYKDGKVQNFLNAISDDDMKYYKSKEEFKTWLSKYIVLEDN